MYLISNNINISCNKNITAHATNVNNNAIVTFLNKSCDRRNRRGV